MSEAESRPSSPTPAANASKAARRTAEKREQLAVRRAALASRRTRLSAAQHSLLTHMIASSVEAPAAAPQTIRHRVEAGPVRLSFAQERLWFLDQLQPGSSAYNIPSVDRFRGPLNYAAMRRALDEIVRRHEALRTVFVASDPLPLQAVQPPGPCVLPVVDLAALPPAARQAQAWWLTREEAVRRFDLARGPLLRATLIRLAAEDHVALTTMHHIVSDGWSKGIFDRELSILYAAFRLGRESPLPELPVQYADFAVWQRRWLQGEVLENQLSYWRRQLSGLPGTVLLPAARNRKGTSRGRGGLVQLRLSTAASEELRALARAEGSTLFIVLLAGLQALVWRYTGQPDFCIGTPIAGRNRVEIEGLIGCFLNTLALRADLSGHPTFRELLGRARETSLGAYANQDLPFERLLDDLQVERDLQRTPLFQVLFNMLNLTMGAAAPARTSTAGAPPGEELQEGVKFDLTVYARENGDDLEILFLYDADLFDGAQMKAISEHFERLLLAAAADPDRRLSEIPLGTGWARQRKRERGHAISSWPDPAPGSIGARFEQVARTYPQAPAVVDADESWSYQRLDRLSSAAAVSLRQALGDAPRIALLFGQDASRVAAVLAALKAGRTYVPLDPAYPRERLSAVLRDAAVGGILSGGAHLGQARELAAGELPVLELGLAAPGAVPESLPEVAPESPAYILYTSGSTGEPKGVVQSHRNVLHHIRTYSEALSILPSDRLSLVASYAFDAAVMDLFGALLNGASLFPFDVRAEGTLELARWLREKRITIYHSTPTLYRRLLEEADGVPFPDLRRVVLGGEKCLRQDLERFRSVFPPGCVFVNGLGPTESTLALQFFATAHSVVDRETVPIGDPVEGTEVTLRNAAGEQVAVYGIGEIEIHSPYLALGYWRRPDLTGAAFLDAADGGDRRTYRTGDLGRWLPDGSLEFVGRGDSQVKVRGHRIELGEIEAALAALPAVREAVVLAQEDEATGETRLIAYLRAAGTEVEDFAHLRSALERRLPEAMIPARFVVVETWPLTATGKVDRASLPAPPEVRCAPPSTGSAPQTPLEELLCGIWADVLQVDRISLQDNFFALGGNSLVATQLQARIRRVLSSEFPLRAVFGAPTVAQMARWIEEARWAAEAVSPPSAIVPVPRDENLPLSFSQQRLWFLQQLQPGTAAYNLPSAVRLSGPVEAPALLAAWTELARRHEGLRTTFDDRDGVPVQRISPTPVVSFAEVDFAQLPAALCLAEAARLAREEARQPFDLTRGPLFRARLLRLGDRDHVLSATFHHIVTDGWSQGIVWRDLSALYGAALRHEPAELPDLPIQYADFSHWQRHRLSGAVLEAQVAYWRERLRGAPVLLDLPYDRPRPTLATLRGASRPLSLPPALAGRLRDLARRMQSTPFMILLAAFQTVLGRLTGEGDLSVGTPVAGRTHVEVEELIGLFVNTLVMRGDLSGDPTFTGLLERTREAALEAHAHQELPFERLVEELQPERSLGISPLFQVMLAFQNLRREALRIDGIELSAFAISTGAVQFDLSLTAAEVPQGIVGSLVYAVDLFDTATADRLLEHLTVLLARVTVAPEDPLSALPILGSAERHQLLVEWGDTATHLEEGLAVHDLILAQARRTPHAVAVLSGAERLTYDDLAQRSAQLARRLLKAGVGTGAFVPVLLDGDPRLVVALLAILRTGAAFVPLDPAWPEARCAAILEEIGEGVVLVDGNGARSFGSLPWRPMVIEPSAHDDELTGDLGEPVLASDEPWPEAPIYVIYTSGSTGRPKGVVIPHRGISNRFRWMDRYFGAAAADRVLQTTRPVYDSAVWQLLWPLTHGGATVMTTPYDSADPGALCERIEEHGITLADFVPAVFNLLVRQLLEGSQSVTRLASLRAVVVGGEEMSPAAAGAFLEMLSDLLLVNLYGPTEASIGCIYHPVRAGDGLQERVPIGKPISNVHPVILDRWGSPAVIGAIGELCLSGPALAASYRRGGDLTAAAFIPNPVAEIPYDRLYRTGDLARWRIDGAIDLIGRTDRQIKIRGLRIELGEIEAVLCRHPGVAAAAVVAWQPGLDARERQLAAYFSGADGVTPPESELRRHLRERLPAYMVPSRFVPLEILPVTNSGKIDRRPLAAIAAERFHSQTAAQEAQPRTPFEEVLAGIWAEVLGRERVGVDDDFFALGGHSLLATQVASRLRRTWGIELPLRSLFESPTVASLARRIEAGLRDSQGPAVPAILPVSRAGELPLSFAQQRLWFLDQLTPEAATYRLVNPVAMIGAVDPEVLGRALAEVVQRHEALRTVFPEVEGVPVQKVSPAARFFLPWIDLSGLPEDKAQVESRRWLGAEAARPFDLAHGPLLRTGLLRLAPERHVLLLVVHHIVCDGWSLRLLTRELSAFYRAFAQGEPSPLPELPIQYVDFAVWQREWMRGEALEREVEYWRHQLAGAAPVIEFPTDRPRPARQSFRGSSFPVSWPGRLSAGLGHLAREENGTLFMAVLTGFYALLRRYTGQSKLAVGMPIANRNRAEIEDLIGNFANTLVLAVAVDPSLSFREALVRVREAAFGAYAHQDLPFEVLVEALSPHRDLSYNPLFQVLFGLHNLPARGPVPAGLSLRPLGMERRTARFDLTLDLEDTPEGMRGTLEYSTDLFAATTIIRLLGHLEALLLGAVAEPRVRLDELPVLSAPERQQVLLEWAGPREDRGPRGCLHELFEQWVRQSPEAVAVVCSGERVTYRELDRRAERLASRLHRLGAGPEVLVGLCLERSLDVIVALLGILKSGAAYLPLDPSYPPQRLARILASAAVPLLVTRGSLVAGLPATQAEIVDLDPAAQADDGESASRPAVRPENLAYVIFTSGSTGGPKGVQIAHRSVVHLLETVSPLLSVARRTWAMVHSIAFDISVWEIWGALASGGRLVVVPQEVLQSPTDLAGLLLDEGVGVLNQTPSALRQLLESGEVAERALGALSFLICGGEALPCELVPALLSCVQRVWNAYGPTESTVWATAGLIGPQCGGGAVPLGRALPDNELLVLDASGQPVPLNVAGELCIAGVGLMRGYFQAPGLTAEKLIPRPFAARPGERLYRTGDLVRRSGRGEIEFLGRIDQQVKVRGFRIEPGEIESVLAENPGVQQAVVLAVEPTPGERMLVVYLVSAGGTMPTVEELRHEVAARLPAYMVPARFVFMENLPLTPNGKVDRQALAASQPQEGQPLALSAARHVLPRGILELRLTRIWEELLPGRQVGVTDDFFVLGGHSILAVRLCARLRAELSLDLPVAALFQHSTVERLAALLCRGAPPVERSVRIEIQSGRGGRPLFLVHPVGGNVLCYLDLARHLGAGQPVYGLQPPELQDGEPSGIADLASHYLAAIRELQPAGPYALGGWSLGGVIAGEIARRLEEFGERAEPLLLIDSQAPLPEVERPASSDLVADFARDLGRTSGIPEDLLSELPEGDVEERLSRVYERARAAGLLPAELDLREIRRLFALYRRNAEALRRYEARPMASPAVLLRAAGAVRRQDPTLGWKRLAMGGVEVIDLPGDHYSILRRPAVEEVARRIAGLLESAPGATTAGGSCGSGRRERPWP